MPSQLAEYARLAAEAFMAASKEADPARATLLRRQGYNFVDLIRGCENDLEQRLQPTPQSGDQGSHHQHD